MKELSFAREPFNTKLFILCFLKKIWLVPVAMVIGAVLIGGCNYLTKVVFGGPAEYEITSSYYVDYYMDPETGQIYTHYNEATWGSMITKDWFTDRIWEHALELGMVPETYGVEKEDLVGFLSAVLLTDVHTPDSTVVTEYPELTEVLNKAVQQTFLDFGEQQPEILGVRVIDETPLQEKDRNDRTLRACILGAVIGAFVACLCLGFVVLFDDSVIVPETFTYRYGIPMLGVVGRGEEALSEEAGVNLRYRFRDKKKVAVTGVGMGRDIPQIALPEGFAYVKTEELADGYEKLRQAEGVLLLIEAGKRNSKEIEHLLHELAVQEVEVTGALLYHGDRKLLKAYYMGRRQK